MRWVFKVKEYVAIGHIPDWNEEEEQDSLRGRWISWDAPWSEDVRQYDCPMRLHYFGKRWCWSFGAHTQLYDWKNDCWADYNVKKNYRRFVLSPRDARERYDRKHVWRWDLPHTWFVIHPDKPRLSRGRKSKVRP